MTEWKPRTLDEIICRYILKTLKHHQGNRTKACQSLGISIRMLRIKLAEYRELGVDVDNYDIRPEYEKAVNCTMCAKVMPLDRWTYQRAVKGTLKNFFCSTTCQNRRTREGVKHVAGTNDDFEPGVV